MRRTVALGVFLFIGFAVAFAPAGLVRLVFDEIDGAALTQPSGTIWRGAGQILIREWSLGTLKWDVRPATLLRGTLGYDLALADTRSADGLQLAGRATVGFNRSFTMNVSGSVPARLVNRLLAPYDMHISGDLELIDTALAISGGVPTSAGGQVTWGGGSVQYILSGRSLSSNLPPLTAFLGDAAEATVFARNGQTPLIRAELLKNGFAKVGITKLFTKMLNNPWPGSDPDHVVVLEVEEQVF